MDATGHAIIVDFDSAAPFGEPLLKGTSKRQLSDRENDFDGLQTVRDFLLGPDKGQGVVEDGDRTPTREIRDDDTS
jgi:hypothetical protein